MSQSSQLSELPRQLPGALQPLVERVGGPRRAVILAVGVAAALLILLLANLASRPTWVPAFTGLPLEQVGKLTERLDTESIPYRLEGGGTQVLVAASDLARARVALAKDGLPSAGRPGLELFDQPSWGMTDFTQRVNYRRALEGELERTIGKMRGVELAQVHLALRETASFRRGSDRPAEASVVLKLANGTTPPQDVVQGIAHLVASSVDGLESEKVTVLDDGGRLLSTPDESGSLAGLTSRQLAVQREVEQHLEGKAAEILDQFVGLGNARVQVSADVNFDRVERTTQSVDPERAALVTEQKAEIVPGAEGGAGSTNIANSYETSRTVETMAGAIGNVRRLTVAVLVNDRPAPAPADGAEPPADAPTSVARTDAELAQIAALVRAAVGVDSARGDQVSVVSVPFSPPAGLEPDAPSTWDRVEQVQKPALTGLALLLAFAIAFLAIRALRPRETVAMAALPGGGTLPVPVATGSPLPQAMAGGMAAANPMAAAMAAAPAGGPDEAMAALAPAAAAELAAPIERPALPPSPAQILREQVVGTVERNPDVAARLVRNWIREG